MDIIFKTKRKQNARGLKYTSVASGRTVRSNFKEGIWQICENKLFPEGVIVYMRIEEYNKFKKLEKGKYILISTREHRQFQQRERWEALMRIYQRGLDFIRKNKT